MGKPRSSITCAAFLLLAATGIAQARVTAIVIDKVEPFADGAPFADAGAYERVIGTVKGELDPQDPRNRGIVDLDKAPRNARGMVEYDTDFFMLRPADPAKASRKLLYEVNNRGRKFLLHWLMEAPPGPSNNDPRSRADAGNGLVFRRGYTIVWSGWGPDAPKAGGGMTMRVPVAQEAGRPIVRTIRDELVNGTRAPMRETFKLSYEAASLDTKEAQLTMRVRTAGNSSTTAPSGSCRPAPSPSPACSMSSITQPKTLSRSASGLRRRATSCPSCVTPRRTIKARKIPPAASTRRSRSESRRAAVTCAISSARDSIRMNPREKCLTACWRTFPASAECFSMRNSASPRAPTRSTRIISIRRMPFRSRLRSWKIP